MNLPPPEYSLEHADKKRELTSLEKKDEFNLEIEAQKWARLVARDKKGQLGGVRIEQAGFNNRLYRYCKQASTIKIAEFDTALRAEMPNLPPAERSKEVNFLLGGIRNLYDAETNIRRKFTESYADTGFDQTLATEDYLDAARMVDLIEIITDTRGRVEKINLIQVKGARDSTPIEDIKAQHKKCLSEFTTIDRALIPERIKELQRSREKFFTELSTADEEAAVELVERYEKLLEVIMDTALNDIERIDTSGDEETQHNTPFDHLLNYFDNATVQEIIDKSGMSITEAVQLFGQAKALEILTEDYVTEAGGDKENIEAARQVAQALSLRLSQRKLSPEELAARFPEAKLPANILPAIDVYSVTYKGGVLAEEPELISKGTGPIALTKK